LLLEDSLIFIAVIYKLKYFYKKIYSMRASAYLVFKRLSLIFIISAAAQIFAFSLTYNGNLPMLLWYGKQVLIKTLKTQE